MHHHRGPQRTGHAVEQRKHSADGRRTRDAGRSLVDVGEAEDDGGQQRRHPEGSPQQRHQVGDQVAAEHHLLADARRDGNRVESTPFLRRVREDERQRAELFAELRQTLGISDG